MIRLLAFGLAALVAIGGVAPGQMVQESVAPDVRIEFADNIPPGARRDLERMLLHAHERIGARLHVGEGAPPILVEWAESHDDFAARLALPPEHTIAAAVPAQRRIIINAPAFNAADVYQRQVTISHEYIHLFLGLHVPGRLPLWLEEGLAMHLSGDTGHAGDFRLTVANSLGRLIPLNDLRSAFPMEPAARSLAYRQAYSATVHYIATHYPARGAAGLVEQLMHPERGPALLDRLWDARATRAIDAHWRDGLSSVWSWIGVASSATVLWGAITALFLVAYLKKRRERKAAEAAWLAEEMGEEDGPP